jgi:hypothetical protein
LAARLAKQETDLLDAPEWIVIFNKTNQVVFAKVDDVKSDVGKFYRVMESIKNDAKLADLNTGDNKIPILGLKTFLKEYSQAKELLKKIDVKINEEGKQVSDKKNKMLERYPLGVIIVKDSPLNLAENRHYIESEEEVHEDIDEPSAAEQKEEEIDYIRIEAGRYVKDILKDIDMTKENLKKIKKDLEKKGVTVPKLDGSTEDITAKLIDAVNEYIRTAYLMKLKDGVNCDLDNPCDENEECDLKHKKCKPKTDFNYYEGMERERYNKKHFAGTHDDIERLKALKKAEKDAEKANKAGEKAKKEDREA